MVKTNGLLKKKKFGCVPKLGFNAHERVRGRVKLGLVVKSVSFPTAGSSAAPVASFSSSSSSSSQLLAIAIMAQFDLTDRVAPFLDRHLVFPLLEFLQDKQIYSDDQILKAKIELLAKTNMVDYAMDIHKSLYHTEDVPQGQSLVSRPFRVPNLGCSCFLLPIQSIFITFRNLERLRRTRLVCRSLLITVNWEAIRVFDLAGMASWSSYIALIALTFVFGDTMKSAMLLAFSTSFAMPQSESCMDHT